MEKVIVVKEIITYAAREKSERETHRWLYNEGSFSPGKILELGEPEEFYLGCQWWGTKKAYPFQFRKKIYYLLEKDLKSNCGYEIPPGWTLQQLLDNIKCPNTLH